jgi:hypothetical protein
MYSNNINSLSVRTTKPHFTLQKNFIGLAGKIDVEGGTFRSEASNSESGID